MKSAWHGLIPRSFSGWPRSSPMVLALRSVRRAPEAPSASRASSYFDSSMTGQPLLWPQGIVTYYTDQGDLSPILPNASANSFVASAFSQWTSVSTAAHIRQQWLVRLAEDVNGTNVIVNSNGTISMPSDIQSTATGTPVGIVYDEDGSVTDALLGAEPAVPANVSPTPSLAATTTTVRSAPISTL